jgi:Na+-translocating ferredoxin:NAD+ oxidoreductase RnfD subunit
VFLKQDIMRKVLYSLVPIFVWSTWLYGWRVIALGTVVFALGIVAEYVMEKAKNKKTSEAVLVSCMLFTLSLPPAVPFWVAGIGIVFAVILGKGAFGGFGRNIFNPAITGRLFIYISFPLLMQTTWMLPGNFGLGGMNGQAQGSGFIEAVLMIVIAIATFILIRRFEGKSKPVLTIAISASILCIVAYVLLNALGLQTNTTLEMDVVSMATPLELMRGATLDRLPTNYEYLRHNSLVSLFIGYRVGSIGESSIFLILIAMIYLLSSKTANWKTMIPSILSGLILCIIFYYSGLMSNPGKLTLLTPVGKTILQQISDILSFMMSGSYLFVAVFMVTDPVSGPNKPLAQYVYGIIIGSIIVLLRVFSGFPEGTSFAILLGNTFANLLDEYSPAPKKKPVNKTPVQGAR